MCTLIADARLLDRADVGQPLQINVPVTVPVREKPSAGLAEIPTGEQGGPRGRTPVD
jgi:hypothetical protein